MHTARLLTVSRTIGGGLPRGVYLEGVSAQMGVSTWRVSAPGVGRVMWPVIAPWTEFLTHACKNITFSQLLLRAVIISSLDVNVC